MKTIIFLLVLSLSTLCTMAQSPKPKGDRVFAWQIDMAQNNNYDSAFAYAEAACLESIHLSFPWSVLETDAGSFDATYMANTLDVANIFFPIKGIKIELQLSPMNTNQKETPADLLATDFDDPAMISRFKALLDTVFLHIPDVELAALNIGNESDIYMGTSSAQYAAFKTFLDEVVPHAEQLYFNLHGTDLKVGTTFTFDGLTGTSTAALCQSANSGLDIVSVTYYPLEPDFTMEAPTVVAGDFTALVNLYPDTLQPIYFAECGYASSDTCNSSEAQQAEFYENVFSAWDTHYDHIKYLSAFKTTDWSTAEVVDFGNYYGITDIRFLEYLRTVGVRTWDNDGTNKLAYETILCELDARSWCATNCTLTGTSHPSEITSVTLYPNPTSGMVNIATGKPLKSVNVYNSFGVLCSTTSQNIIHLEGLPNGVYFAELSFETGKPSKRKIIKH